MFHPIYLFMVGKRSFVVLTLLFYMGKHELSLLMAKEFDSEVTSLMPAECIHTTICRFYAQSTIKYKQ